MDDPGSFGDWLRERRRVCDLSREELARRVSCAIVTIKKIESGERRPSRQIAELILDALAVPSDERTAIVRLARATPAPAGSPPPAPPLTSEDLALEDLSGRAVRGYALRERLGAGGFGVAYRADQPGIGRAVAIKIILPQYANHPDFIRRFEAEAQFIARLEHPHIVPLYDYWREPGGAYLVMRYVGGGTLQAALQRGPLPLDTSARLLEQVGAALALAHRASIVHRDLKPSNILLDTDGNAYLADFGIAKDLGNADPGSQTQVGAIVGSPAYLSPEQVKDEPVTPRSDIYSLGVMLYELLTGQKPFQAPTPAHLIQKHINEPLPPLRACRPDLPAALDVVIQRATAKNPADRYPDVLALITDFRQITAPPGAAVPAAVSGVAAGGHTASEYATAEIDLPDLANPYKGLRAFTEADAANFFGRDALVMRLLERMAEESLVPGPWSVAADDRQQTTDKGQGTNDSSRFLAVIGPSGSGKSSVVRAGLIPALRRGGLPGSDRWFIAELLPGAHPLEELELALLRLATDRPANLAEHLARDERGLLRAARLILPPDDESELLLVIDQFEELFTLVEDEAAREHFLASLVAAATDPRSRVRVVITLRADFYDRPLLYASLGELVRTRTEVILPLNTDELEHAIVGPARRAGLALEPGLVAAIVRDVGDQPGALPLLQYALTELFERRQGRTLTLAAYRESGGTNGALARRAEQLYAQLDAPGQEAAQQLFLRLVTPGEGVEDTRRRVPVSEFGFRRSGGEERAHEELQGAGGLAAGDATGGTGIPRDQGVPTRGAVRPDEPNTPRSSLGSSKHSGGLGPWHDSGLHPLSDHSQRFADGAGDARDSRQSAEHAPTTGADRTATGSGASGHDAQSTDHIAQSQKSITPDSGFGVRISEPRIPNSVQQVIDAYGRARLLTFDRDPTTRGPTVEVAHEALIRAWSRLRAWLDASRADVRTQRRLSRSAAEWVAAGHDPSYLATGARLAQFAALAETGGLTLNRDERAFLDASRERAEREAVERETQRQRELETAQQLAATEQRRAEEQRQAATRLQRRAVLLAGALALALVAAILAGIFARNNATLATQNAASAATAQASFVQAERLRLAAEANAALDPGASGELPALLALRSLRYGYSPQADAALLNALTRGFTVQQFAGQSKADYAAFSPDGRYVLTAGQDMSAHLWDLATGQELRQFDGPTGEIRRVAYSPDGNYALTSGRDGTARLWDVGTSQELRQFNGHASLDIDSAAFSPDGKYVLTGGQDGIARLWDVTTGQELRRFTGHTGKVLDIAFAPDGKTVLTGSSDATARLWDVATGKQLLQFSGHAVAFAPGGKTMLTGGADRSARLWDAATGKLVQFFAGHSGDLNSVAFSPDGKMVLTGSDDRTARLWNVSTGQQLRVFNGHSGAILSVAFSSDGNYVLTTGQDDTARLWVARAGLEPLTLSSNTTPIQSVAFSPDGKRILTGSVQSLAELWDAQTGERLRTFDGDPGAVTSVAFAPDGRHALTVSAGKPAALWDVQIGERLRAISGSTGYGAAAFSPDGKMLLTSSDDKTARLWDVTTGQELHQFSGHSEPIAAVAFAPDGKTILTGSDDKTARLWDVATGKEVGRLNGHTDAVAAVALSPDGKYVLTGSDDKTARLWDAATGREIRVFAGHGERVTGVAFSPDGKYVLTGSADRTARLWDAATGQELRRYTGHTDAVTAVAFAPDGKSILTGSADKTARLWRTDIGDVVQLACSLLRRDLTAEERAAHNIADDSPTCPKT